MPVCKRTEKVVNAIMQKYFFSTKAFEVHYLTTYFEEKIYKMDILAIIQTRSERNRFLANRLGPDRRTGTLYVGERFKN